MLKKGDKIDLTYYGDKYQIQDTGWVVEEYDNGLLKVVKKLRITEVTNATGEKVERPKTKQKQRVMVLNLRSIGFLRAVLVE